MKILVSLIIFLHAAVGQDDSSFLPKAGECGKLNEAHFYNEKNTTALDEFPWVGQIFFKNNQSQIAGNKCAAVLIGKRHFLANASCMEEVLNGEAISVVWGRWNSAGTQTAQSCHERGECGPRAAVYEIDEIAINPDYNDKLFLHLNDIALVRMAKEVVFSEHIQPLCLPPSSRTEPEFVGQYLTYAGYDFKSTDMRKTVAHMRSLKSCRQTYVGPKGIKDLELTENEICASCYAERRFLPGSALMAVAASSEAEPSNYYVYALLLGGPPRCSPDAADIFVRVGPYVNWIKYNMV